MAALRAIFFDIGDTLLFDEPSLIDRVRMAIESVGPPYRKEEMPRAFRRAEDWALARYVEGTAWEDPQLTEECAAIMLTELGVTEAPPATVAALRDSYLGKPFTRKLHSDAIDLVDALKRRGFVVGAISDWEETLPALLAELELASHLDALAVSAIVGATKPSPRIFEEALRQAGVAADEALHVGDYYELDVAGARAAHVAPLFFDWKGRKPDADCPRVTTFEDMKDYLLALPAPGALRR